jgi:hypothetical protein
MSRDRRDRPEATDPADPADPERSTQLLTAYVDGVAELPVDERRAVERRLADDPQARADADAVRDLLGRLRALPPTYDTGEPPDWAAMERSIRQAVADEVPRPWWRRWRWLVPAMTCAAAAAMALALWPRPAAVRVPSPAPEPASEGAPPGSEPPAGDDMVPLWLDGSEVDVDLARPGAPGAIEQMLGAAPHADDLDAVPPGDENGLLPAAGMAWIDDLDDAALDRAERVLASPPGAPRPTPSGPSGPSGSSRSKG